jgi:hypothetical protein
MLRVLRSSFITWISVVGAVVSGIASLGDIASALGLVGGVVFSIRLWAVEMMSLVAKNTGIVIWSTNLALMAFLLCVLGVAFGLRSWLLNKLAQPDYEFSEWVRTEMWAQYRERLFKKEMPRPPTAANWKITLPLNALFTILWISSYFTMPEEPQVNQVVLRMLLIIAGASLIVRIPYYLRASLPNISYESVASIEKKWLTSLWRSGAGREKLPHRGVEMVDKMPAPVREYYKYHMLIEFLLDGFRRCVYLVIFLVSALAFSAYVATFGLLIGPALSALKLAALLGLLLIAMPFILLVDASMLENTRAALWGITLGTCIGICIGLEGRMRAFLCATLGVFFCSVAAISVYHKSGQEITLQPVASIARASDVAESVIAASPLMFLACAVGTLIGARVLISRESRRRSVPPSATDISP